MPNCNNPNCGDMGAPVPLCLPHFLLMTKIGGARRDEMATRIQRAWRATQEEAADDLVADVYG